MIVLDAFQFFYPMGEGYQLLEAGATKTHWIVMKFGMFLISPKENAVSIDDLALRKKYFVTPYWPAPAID